MTEERKWCYYCRKDNHNDDECWCTRPVGFFVAGDMLLKDQTIRNTNFDLTTSSSSVLLEALRQAGKQSVK